MAREKEQPGGLDENLARGPLQLHGLSGHPERGMGAVVSVVHDDFPALRFEVTLSAAGVPVGFAVLPAVPFPVTVGDALDQHHSRAPVPAGQPVTARLLRRLPLGEIQDFARRVLTAEWAGPGARSVMHSERWAGAFATARRPGRAGRSDHAYAAVAALYVDLGHDVHEVATKLNYSASQVRNILYEARRRGLLTKAEPGKAGGQLTDRAKQLLTQGDK